MIIIKLKNNNSHNNDDNNINYSSSFNKAPLLTGTILRRCTIG